MSHDGYRAEGANMLPPHQIRNIKQISPFSLAVEEVKVDGVDKGPTQILISYSEQGRLLLELPNFIQTALAVSDNEIQVRYKDGSEPWKIFITKQVIGNPTVEARSTRDPITLVDSPISKKFEAVLLSPPNFFNRSPFAMKMG